MTFKENLPNSLSLEEEQELARIIQNGPTESRIEARNKLVENNLRFVLMIANSVGRGLEYDQLEELRSYAVERVLEDALRFRPQNVKFISYLASYLSDELRSYRGNLTHQGRQRIPIEGVYPLRLNQTATIRDSYSNEEGWKGDSWEDSIPDENAKTPEEIYEEVERDEVLGGVLGELSRIEERVLKMNFGIDYLDLEGNRRKDGGLRLVSIGNLLGGLTGERIRQIRDKALERLREKFEDYDGGNPTLKSRVRFTRKYLRGETLYERPIRSLDLDTRTYSLLLAMGVNYLGDLVEKTHFDLLGYEGFGQKHLHEVVSGMSRFGLELKGEYPKSQKRTRLPSRVRKKQIMDILYRNNGSRISEIASEMGLGRRAVCQYLLNMRRKNMVYTDEEGMYHVMEQRDRLRWT